MTNHDIGPRTSKPSSPSEEPNSRILRGYCGVEGFGNLGPSHIKPKAHAEEEEVSEDEHRKSRLPGHTAEDIAVLGKPGSRKRKVPHHQGESPRASQGKPERNGPAVGAWWRSNSRKGCHLCIKYPQLTSWPHLCGRDPWAVLSESQ